MILHLRYSLALTDKSTAENLLNSISNFLKFFALTGLVCQIPLLVPETIKNLFNFKHPREYLAELPHEFQCCQAPRKE